MSDRARIARDVRAHLGVAVSMSEHQANSLTICGPGAVQTYLFFRDDFKYGDYCRANENTDWTHIPRFLLPSLLLLQAWRDGFGPGLDELTPLLSAQVAWQTILPERGGGLTGEYDDPYDGAPRTVRVAKGGSMRIASRVIPPESLAVMAISREYRKRAKDDPDE